MPKKATKYQIWPIKGKFCNLLFTNFLAIYVNLDESMM